MNDISKGCWGLRGGKMYTEKSLVELTLFGVFGRCELGCVLIHVEPVWEIETCVVGNMFF